MSSMGERSPSYHCSDVLLPLSVFSSWQTAIFSNYHFWLLAPLQKNSTICSIRNVVQGLENRLMNHLLHLPLRKQSLCALRCLFSKLNGELGHSSAFLGLQMPRSKRKSSLSETTPTAKRAHTFRAFAEVPSTMCRNREAHQKRASTLVSIYKELQGMQ